MLGESLKHSVSLTEVRVSRGYLYESIMMSQAITCSVKAAYDVGNTEDLMHLCVMDRQQENLQSCLELAKSV